MVNEDTVARVAAQAEMSLSFMVFMATAGVLAAVALLTGSVPVLVGSMVVAPALPPLALVAFALVGRKPALALRGLGVAVAGIALATVCAVLTTWVLNVTGVMASDANLLEKPLLEERVRPGWYSVITALAAGVAGTTALAKEKTDTVVGVVAALALVPAAAAAGIALMSRDPSRAWGGLGLLGINMGLIVVTGVVTLLLLRPDRAK